MAGNFTSEMPLPEFSLWKKMKAGRQLVSFGIEVTARCNNNCAHCYINLPAGDKKAKSKEMPLKEIKNIADQAVRLGALWCLITGGEPLLREDFFELYLYLKSKGLLVSVFTNATMITKKHAEFFKKYPPRDIEITVYGVTEDTYEKVTRRKGSFGEFMRGIDLLKAAGVKIRFKAMAIRSNVHELPEIARFCRKYTKDYFRFDPFLHLRFDRNEAKNRDIVSERLAPDEIVKIEKADSERSSALEKNCDKLINEEYGHYGCDHLFHCGAGNGSFDVTYDGRYRLCSSLWHPDCMVDLKKVSLRDAFEKLVPKVRDMRSKNEDFLKKCRKCPIINLCIWCPAHSYLESGRLDEPVDYFCKVAHARAEAISGEKRIYTH